MKLVFLALFVAIVAAITAQSTFATPATEPAETPPATEPAETPPTESEPEPTPTPTPEPETEAETSQDDTIDPCLIEPSLDSCPKPDPITQECPPGYNRNEDDDCFPAHDHCPDGYHGHEDDETGRCIINSTPCDEGYQMNEQGTNCDREHFTCDGKPSVVPCNDNEPRNDTKIIIVKKIIKNTDVINKIDSANNDLDIDQTIVAINFDEGAGINCVFAGNNGACETFDVTKDPGKEPLLQIIPFS